MRRLTQAPDQVSGPAMDAAAGRHADSVHFTGVYCLTEADS
jgi:hypothetical protein